MYATVIQSSKAVGIRRPSAHLWVMTMIVFFCRELWTSPHLFQSVVLRLIILSFILTRHISLFYAILLIL